MDSKLINLVGHVYDTVTEPDKWNQFLDKLTHTLGGHASRLRFINRHNNHHDLMAGIGHEPAFDKVYHDYYWQLDPWNPYLEESEVGTVLDSCMIPDHVFRKTECYNEFYKHYDTFYAMGGHIERSPQRISRLGIHRPYSQGPFSEQEKQIFQKLMPHLQRALSMRSHLNSLSSQHEAMLDALYRSNTAIMFINEYERVSFVSQRAEEILAAGRGLSLFNHQLSTSRQEDTQNLRQYIHSAVQTGLGRGASSGGGLRIFSDAGHHELNLVIIPFRTRNASITSLNTRTCATVFLHDVKQEAALPDAFLQQIYHLTQAEIRLAQALLNGCSVKDASETFGISVNTVRTQLRSLFSKTGTQRQSELIHLLSRLTGMKQRQGR